MINDDIAICGAKTHTWKMRTNKGLKVIKAINYHSAVLEYIRKPAIFTELSESNFKNSDSIDTLK